MKQRDKPLSAVPEAELSSLITSLHSTIQRIEEMTDGEIDAVSDLEGRTFLLRRAQEQLRHTEEARQAAILNALPAHIALLDAHGTIISVNDAWKDFADANALRDQQHGIGANYLDLCDAARGMDAADAHGVAAGLRAVLSGEAKTYSVEYSCHAPSEQRWFLLTATPLSDTQTGGAVVMHTNITERRAVEKALEELSLVTEKRERVLSTTLASIRDFAYIFDLEGRFLFANEPLLNLLGITLEQITGKSFLDLGYPEDLALHLQSQIQEVFTTNASVVDETPFVSPTGVPGFYEYIFSPVVGAGGTVELVVGSTRDVTERKRAENDVRQSRKHLRDMIDGLGPAMFVGLLTPQGILVEVNRAPLDAAGLRPEDVLGRPFADAHWWSWSTEVQAQLREAIVRAARGQASRFDVRTRGAKDQFIDIDFSLQPLRNESGEVVFLIPSASIITERKSAEAALQKSETEFRALAESIPQMVWVADAAGRTTFVNHRWTDYTGFSLELSRVDGWMDVIHPEDREQAAQAWQLALSRAGTYSQESRLRRVDGVYRWWLVRGAPVQDAAGAIEKWFGTCTDIHDMKLAEHEISRSNEALRDSEIKIKRLNRVYAVLSQINALIVRAGNRDELFNEACRIAVEDGEFRMAMIVMLNRSTGKIELTASAGKNQLILDLVSEILGSADVGKSMTARAMRDKAMVVSNNVHDDPAVLLGSHYLRAGVRSVALLPLIVEGEAVGALALYAAETDFFLDAELTLLSGLSGDISFALDHIEKQDRLNYLAYYDALTGLANRSLYLERVGQHMRSASSIGRKLGVGLIDIERFKNINDSLGQAAGDQLLKQVADWLALHLGDAAMVARVGADHFAVVLPVVKPDGDVVGLIEKKMAAFRDHTFRLNDGEFRISFKVGVAMYPEDGDDAATLFKNAEAALKKAKRSGERYLFFAQNMTAQVAGKLNMENQLRQAIDNKEFVLYYQPKVNMATGKLTSAEALIRWNDPRTGLVPPGQFIPILEETGLIHEVGRWALRKAVEDYLRWRAAGLAAVRIAVNVSPLQLQDRGFINDIRQALGPNADAAEGIELEITESVVMADVEHSIDTLRAIRTMGVTIAIDDFGTGFSSLSYLSKLPVDTLKIDRAFVNQMTAAPDGLALVSTIITLAHSLKLKVVAEGVETEVQRQQLHSLHCDEMQGFLFSKPLPCEIFEEKYLGVPGSLDSQHPKKS